MISLVLLLTAASPAPVEQPAAPDDDSGIVHEQKLGRVKTGLIGTGLVLGLDAALFSASYLGRAQDLGRVTAVTSGVLGGAMLGTLLGFQLTALFASGEWTIDRTFLAIIGGFVGLAIGAVLGGVGTFFATDSPGLSRPVTAGVSLSVGSAIVIPFFFWDKSDLLF